MIFKFKKFLVFLIILFLYSNLYSSKETWEKIKTSFEDKKFGEFPAFIMIDIDGDGDKDAFIGNWDGYLNFYRNISEKKNDMEFKMENTGASIKNSFQEVSTYNGAVPFWVDIDGDSDYDLFLGNLRGTITYYKNVGTPAEPELELVNKGDTKKTSYFNIKVEYNSVPVFIDIDGDNDMDLFIGERDGYINYYENTGDSRTPVFKEVNFAESIESSYNKIDVGECSYPYFIDIDMDGDYDLFIGNWEGYMFFYKNDGTKFEPFFKEVNYAVSPGTSFNAYHCDGDCRFVITKFLKDKFDFIFCKMNGEILWYRTTSYFKDLFKKEKHIDVIIKMANYYYEAAKEKYLSGRFIESKLILDKGKRYKKIKKLNELSEILKPEIKKEINRNVSLIDNNFAKGNFVEAMDFLMDGKFMRASVLFEQIGKNYRKFGDLFKYIKIAKKYEKERKKYIMAERFDDKAIELYRIGKYTLALNFWEKASALVPDDYTIVENIIMCKTMIDEIDTKEVVGKLVREARVHLKKGRKKQALIIYVRIMEIGNVPEKIQKEINTLKNDIMKIKEEENMDRIEELYKAGSKYLKNKQYEKAIDVFKKVIFYKSGYKDVWEKLKTAENEFFKKEEMK